MVLTVHHLGKSQSERIVWLCEELAIPYELVIHDRNPETALSPESLKALHPAGTGPVMIDDPSPTADGGRVALAESGAIAEYINTVHGGGRLALKPSDKGYTDYIEFFHFANGSLQATLSRMMIITRVGGDGTPFAQFVDKKWDTQCAIVEERLKKTGAYLAGPELTLADIMTVFTFTTMRGFKPVDLSAYPSILAYLKRVGERDAYKKAMEKGDPDVTPKLGPTAEKFVFGKVGK